MGRVRRDIAERFELDPALTHLNHGAFGAVPRSVRPRSMLEPVSLEFSGQ